MVINDRVKFEQADEADAELLAEISKKAFETDVEVGAPGLGGPLGYDSPEFQERVMGFMDYYKILLDNEVVGGIFLDSRNNTHHVLERMFVNPKHYRHGIGTRVLELLWEIYPEVRMWTLGTPEWNKRTKRFFEKLGFVQIGWKLSDSEWRERWYQLIVDPSKPYEMMGIDELRAGMKNVTVEGKILEKSIPRMVRSRRRRWVTLTVANAGFGDDTGRVVLVLWNKQIRWVKMEDRVRVENGYVGSYRGVTQLNLGKGGKLIILI